MNNEVPNHVAIIMDGNRRWAKQRGLKTSEGHYAGYKTLKKVACYILSKGIKYLSVFAFSTENFGRSIEEVNYLMDLFVKSFKKEIPFFIKNNIKVVFSGRKNPLSDKVYESMMEVEDKTNSLTGGIFNICLNYGGQAEIVDACKKIVNDTEKNIIDINDINTDLFYKYLYNYLPPIDLLIRTSGEMRLSNFMLYSLSYSELYFTDTYFPDFDEKEFDKALLSYQSRDRRKGVK